MHTVIGLEGPIQSIQICTWICRVILIPGVAVVLQNLYGRDIILEPHTEVGVVTAANIGPSIEIPNKQELKENENVQCKTAEANLSEDPTRKDRPIRYIPENQFVKNCRLRPYDTTGGSGPNM